MNILSIIAQKPGNTGSGVYLYELTKQFAKLGHNQAIVAGITMEDNFTLPQNTSFHPVYFESDELPFPVVGMSDEMPYTSTRYCDMTSDMVEQFQNAFMNVIKPLIKEFKPDLILCHHLYLLTATVREAFPDLPIFGFCHNTDLRQMKKTDLMREYIRKQIHALDHIFVPQKAQYNEVITMYQYPADHITMLGMGYNNQLFYNRNQRPHDGVTRIIYVGKIAGKKGLFSLLRAIALLDKPKDKLEFYFVGSSGNKKEALAIEKLANTLPYKAIFTGRLSHEELIPYYNKCDIFVLPSFYEGIPLTAVEALACGLRVVITDLPGVQDWLSASTDNATISYVTLPTIQNTDEPVADELPAFEQRLAAALQESITSTTTPCDVSRISWTQIAKNILNCFSGNGM
ncbi:MAG: glycosyltransferase family 4 protein [Eubacterium sp.]|nr:glycosyltransferase family 4 protein [Eubacterium sp.]